MRSCASVIRKVTPVITRVVDMVETNFFTRVCLEGRFFELGAEKLSSMHTLLFSNARGADLAHVNLAWGL